MRSDLLLNLLNAKSSSKRDLKRSISDSSINIDELKRVVDSQTFPSGTLLKKLLNFTKLSLLEFKMKCGFVDSEVVEFISSYDFNNRELFFIDSKVETLRPQFQTGLGSLYKGDCITLLRQMDDDSIDLIFADPPFNLGKLYPSKMNDKVSEGKYISWSQEWLFECSRVLKPGGSLFVWNIPKWNKIYAAYLDQLLTFRHWISTDIKYSLPIAGRLYPSHYSLLYYCKGEKPATFNPDRLKMEVCTNCYKELKDYGGYKHKMNPLGINMTDVWYDIPPVRHNKFKGRSGSNELSIKLMDRIIEMASNPGDLVFDPFGGAGTTYITSEIKERRWIGIELGPLDDIINRFSKINAETELLEKYRSQYNSLFPDKIKAERIKRHIWTDDSVKKKKKNNMTLFSN